MAYASTFFERSRQNAFSTSQAAENLECFEQLVDTTWTIYTVSKLFNFEATSVNLSKYAKKIRERLGGVLSENQSKIIEIKCRIHLEPEFSETIYDEAALCIEVTKTERSPNFNNDDENGVEKVIYTGYLLSRGQSEADVPNTPQLPVLITKRRGPEKLADCIHGVLQTLFDCIISRYVFDLKDLQWLLAISVNLQDHQAGTGHIALTYTIPLPEQCDKNEVKLEFETGITKELLTSIQQCSDASDTDEILAEHVTRLMSIITQHAAQVYKTHIDAMVMTSVMTPNALFNSSGQFKAASKETVAITLKYLTTSLVHQLMF